jgi:type I restriction enzyme, S subunit
MNVLRENTAPYLHTNASPALHAQDFHNTELGLLPRRWEVISLLETSILKARIGWQGLTTAEYLERGDYYLVTGTDFFNGKIKWETCHYVDAHRYNQDKNIQLKNGDVLVTKDGTIGKVAYVEELNGKATLNSGVFVIRPKNNVYLPKYFFYVLCSPYFDTFLKQLTAGSTIVHLYQKDFVNFKFPLPPLPEQARIAEILQDQDALIGRQEEAIDKQKMLKQATMQALLQPKEGWEVRRLGDLAYIQRGASPRPIDSPVWFDNNSKIGWLRISDVSKAKKYLFETTQKLSNLGVKSSRFAEKGSLIMSICATIGKPIIAGIDVCIHDGFVLFSNLQVAKEYLYYVLEFIEDDWSKNGQTGSQMNLNTDLINNKLMHYPNLEEQTRIATILSDMDAEIEAMEAELQKQKAIKEGLMQELLTGKRRTL